MFCLFVFSSEIPDIRLLYSEGAAEVIENENDIALGVDEVQAKSPLAESEISSGPTITAAEVGPDFAKSENTGELSEQSGISPQKETTTKGLCLLV